MGHVIDDLRREQRFKQANGGHGQRNDDGDGNRSIKADTRGDARDDREADGLWNERQRYDDASQDIARRPAAPENHSRR